MSELSESWSLDDELRVYVDGIAAKVTVVDGDGRGFDPATIMLLLPVIKALLQCFMRNDNLTASDVKANVIQFNDRNPRKLRRRTINAIKREYKQRGEKLSEERAAQLADAAIDEIIDADSTKVEMMCCALAEE